MSQIDYTAPKVCAQFMLSEQFVRLIAGPVGSGKTTACILELFRRASEQVPAPDGYRYTRFAVVRQTLSQLKLTVLKDILQWLRGFAMWRVSESTIYVEIGDIRSEWILMPMEDAEDQRRLLSSQLTGAWISECIEIDANLVSAIAGRCGRYPGANLGGCTHSFIIADTNMPEEGSAWHELMTTTTPPDWQIFIQPGGLEPDAENLEWLLQTSETLKLPVDHPDRLAQGRRYYERLSRGNSEAWVQRYVHAKYGIDPSGRAVFGATFKPTAISGDIVFPWHVAPSIEPVAGLTLLIGQDFGRDPCAVITQVDHNGRLLVLQEIISRHMGLEKHVNEMLRPTLMGDRYLGKPMAVVGDPAGVAKNSIFEITSFDMLKAAGFHAFPAPTNDIDPRLRAVEAWLLASRGAGPAIVFDAARCPTLVRAMKMGYRFENVKSATAKGETKPKPLKNEYSHIADALQYACLAALGGALGYINNQLRRPRANGMRPHVTAAGWT
jgi:hypothetical protein